MILWLRKHLKGEFLEHFSKSALSIKMIDSTTHAAEQTQYVIIIGCLQK